MKYINRKNSVRRPNSAVIVGGILGDEGKGRIVDELVSRYLTKHQQVVVYRDNGGANAGHTVQVGEKKIALHQLGSGVLNPRCLIVLGKDMVLHPEDLVSEIKKVEAIIGDQVLAQIKIEQLAVLSLDTHRAFENTLKNSHGSGKGATGRGISPAYADIIYRHPVKMRDLLKPNWRKKLTEHYELYEKLVAGFGQKLAKQEVARITGELTAVGDLEEFLNRIAKARKTLTNLVVDTYPLMEKFWQSNTPIVFEKAQALGIDIRWGVYPDVTASNCAPDGILSSTQGIVDPRQLPIRAAVIKSTYTSSVGSRVLPTMMEQKLAEQIRQDAHEYGSTTGRPRDIAYLDLPMLSFLCRVGGIEQMVFTHMDIVYPNVPIKVCVGYEIKGKKVTYRPDQEFLNLVKPVYREFKPWPIEELKTAKKSADLPVAARRFIEFVCKQTDTKPLMLTSGPKRSQSLFF